MIFYCPNCREEYDVEPTGKIVTKSNRVAYKSVCPTCGQDMAEFMDPKSTLPTDINQGAMGSAGGDAVTTPEPVNPVAPAATAPTATPAPVQPDELSSAQAALDQAAGLVGGAPAVSSEEAPETPAEPQPLSGVEQVVDATGEELTSEDVLKTQPQS